MTDERAGLAPGATEVFAAGGVIWRRRSGRVEVVVVHRPHRQDWSLPKGKVDPGETVEETAQREVVEETGLTCSLDQPLGAVSYVDHKGRAKTVWYWAMTVLGGTPTLNDEVDEIAWLDVAAARARVDYETDRTVLDRFAALSIR